MVSIKRLMFLVVLAFAFLVFAIVILLLAANLKYRIDHAAGYSPTEFLKTGSLCVKEGGTYGMADTTQCCQGLTNVSPYFYPAPEGSDYSDPAFGNCIYSGAGGSYICINCGDDICSSIENTCNCPRDCKN